MPKPPSGPDGPRRLSFLRMIILKILMDNGRLAAFEIAELSDNCFSKKTVYKPLERLVRQGFVKTTPIANGHSWKNGPQKRYWITEKGVEDLYDVVEFIKMFFDLKDVD